MKAVDGLQSQESSVKIGRLDRSDFKYMYMIFLKNGGTAMGVHNTLQSGAERQENMQRNSPKTLL